MQRRLPLRDYGDPQPLVLNPTSIYRRQDGTEPQETWHEHQMKNNAFYKADWEAKVAAGLNPPLPDPNTPILQAPDEHLFPSMEEVRALGRQLYPENESLSSEDEEVVLSKERKEAILRALDGPPRIYPPHESPNSEDEEFVLSAERKEAILRDLDGPRLTYPTEESSKTALSSAEIQAIRQQLDGPLLTYPAAGYESSDEPVSGGKPVSRGEECEQVSRGRTMLREKQSSRGRTMSRGKQISRGKISGGKQVSYEDGTKPSQSREPRMKTPYPRPATPMFDSKNHVSASTITTRAREVREEPYFEPTARAAIEAKHEAHLNNLLNREPDPEEHNLYAATIIRQDLRDVQYHQTPTAVDETTTKQPMSLKSPRKLLGFLRGSFRPSTTEVLPTNTPLKASRLLASPPAKERLRGKKVERSATSVSFSKKDITSAFASITSRFHTRTASKDEPRMQTSGSGLAPNPRPHTSHMAYTSPSRGRISRTSVGITGKAGRLAMEARLANKPLPAYPPSEDSSTDYSVLPDRYRTLAPIPDLPRPITRGRSLGSQGTVAPKYLPPKAAEYRGVVNAGMRVASQYANVEEGSSQTTPRAAGSHLPTTFYSPSNFTLDTVDRASGFSPSRNADPARYIVASPPRPSRQEIAQPQPLSARTRRVNRGTIHMIFQGDAHDISPDATLEPFDPTRLTQPHALFLKSSDPVHHTPTLRRLEYPARPDLALARPLAPKNKMIANLQDNQDRKVVRRRPGSADMKDQAQANRRSLKDAQPSPFRPQHPSALPMPLYANGRGAMYSFVSSASPTHDDARPPTHAESGVAAYDGNDSQSSSRHDAPAPGHNVALFQPFLSPPPEHAFYASPISDVFSPTASVPPMPAVLYDGSDVLTHFGVVNHHMDELHKKVKESFGKLNDDLDKSGDGRKNELSNKLDALLPTTVIQSIKATEPKLDKVMTLLADSVVVSLASITEQTTGSQDNNKVIHQKLDKQQQTLEAILEQLKLIAVRSNNGPQFGHHPRRSYDNQRGAPDPNAFRINHHGQEGGIVAGRTGRHFASEAGPARSDSNINLVRQHPEAVDGTYYNQFPTPGQVIGTFGGITYVQGNPLPHNGPANYENNGSTNFPYGYDSRR